LTSGGGHGEGAQSVATYIDVYSNVGLLAVGVGVFVGIIAPLLKKRMHGIH